MWRNSLAGKRTDDELVLVQENEVSAAHTIIKERVAWLLQNGIEQFLSPYPVEYVQRLQKRGELYGVHIGKSLTGIVAISRGYMPDYWKRKPPQCRFAWISLFFTSLQHKGKATGDLVLNAADGVAAECSCKLLLLDCYHGNGFLPAYYEKRGWTRIEEKSVQVGSDRTIRADLMAKSICNSADPADLMMMRR